MSMALVHGFTVTERHDLLKSIDSWKRELAAMKPVTKQEMQLHRSRLASASTLKIKLQGK